MEENYCKGPLTEIKLCEQCVKNREPIDPMNCVDAYYLEHGYLPMTREEIEYLKRKNTIPKLKM